VPVKNIVLLPVGGMAQMQAIPEKPLYEMVIAGAGPLVNLVIAVSLMPAMLVFARPAFWLGFFNTPGMFVDTALQSFFQRGAPLGLIVFLFLANLILFLFNLIPAYPMDGGRLLRASLAFKLSYHRSTHLAIGIGRVLAILLILTALYVKSLGLFFVAIFVLMAGRPLRRPRI
jgi:Zn-dependent protease